MPDNAEYLNLGVVVVVAVMSLYILMLIFRFRAALRERQALKQFQIKNSSEGAPL